MTDPGFQLRVLESAVDELESYLLSPEVFWRVSAAADLPNLTLGGLELSRRALAAASDKLDPAARQRAHTLIEKIDEFRRESRLAWERKAASELNVRLSQWQAYLQELAELPGELERYPQEVRARAMATYLLEEAVHQPQAAEARKRLEALDAQLRASFASGGFIWDPSLAEAYPEGTHWFLYGRPKT